jgi:hypothetical protein
MSTNGDPQEPREKLDEGPDGLDAIPGLTRLALSAWWRTTGWAVRTSLGVPRHALDVVRGTEHRRTDEEQRPRGAPQTPTPREPRPQPPENGSAPIHSLREAGELLLRRSRDVRYEVDAHPAYERILSELAPDEGRILRLLLLHGPQPAVDIRTGGPIGLVRSRLIAPGLSMIGARAGCRYVERVPSYLNNLFRLGLVWFSRETLQDPLAYQVLEAQPEVLDAIHSVRQTKVVRRSIHLTPFGEDFCRVCLSSDATTAAEYPAHSSPPRLDRAPQPPTESVDG